MEIKKAQYFGLRLDINFLLAIQSDGESGKLNLILLQIIIFRYSFQPGVMGILKDDKFK